MISIYEDRVVLICELSLVRGEMWRWNLDQLIKRIDLFNRRRILGIVQDDRSG
jgi:hypothetical protein